MTQIWAHRGARHDAPENTLAAFALAIEQKADGVEFDVQAERSELLNDSAVERHQLASFRTGRLFSKKFTVSITAKEMKRFTITQKTAGPSRPICQ